MSKPCCSLDWRTAWRRYPLIVIQALTGTMIRQAVLCIALPRVFNSGSLSGQPTAVRVRGRWKRYIIYQASPVIPYPSYLSVSTLLDLTLARPTSHLQVQAHTLQSDPTHLDKHHSPLIMSSWPDPSFADFPKFLIIPIVVCPLSSSARRPGDQYIDYRSSRC